jgi:hypothetical protein
VKRMLDCQASDFQKMSGRDLKRAILAAEGRTILSELIVSYTPLFGDVSNPEVARAFGVDLLLLNFFDVNHPRINGLPVEEGDQVVRELRRLVGRPIGVNLEPVDPAADMVEDRVAVPEGRRLTAASARKLTDLGFDFVCITGNPKTGVSNEEIVKGIRVVREVCGPDFLIIAGKMHAAGIAEEWTEDTFEQLGTLFVEAGADVVLFPAPGTVPGVDGSLLRKAVARVHNLGGLVMLAVGTSQEGADTDTIRQIALSSKMVGADIFHLGDAGYLGMASPENLLAASIAIRGVRHTYRRMAASVNR